jgi:hypothetical protein
MYRLPAGEKLDDHPDLLFRMPKPTRDFRLPQSGFQHPVDVSIKRLRQFFATIAGLFPSEPQSLVANNSDKPTFATTLPKAAALVVGTNVTNDCPASKPLSGSVGSRSPGPRHS